MMDLLLHIPIGIKENPIMLRLVLVPTSTRAVSQWDGDILMNENFNGVIFNAIIGDRCTFANELRVIICI